MVDKFFSKIVALGVLGTAVYALVVRPWHMTWGASADEVDRTLPGDEIVMTPKIRVTHAVTIRASAAEVWPWLVQLGQGRGGFYSYDFLENMMGLDIHSADTILPQHQQLEIGDIIPLMPNGEGIPVASIDPGHYLVLGGHLDHTTEGSFGPKHEGEYMTTSWAFVLEEVAPGVTRLIERAQYDYNDSPANAFFYRVILEPGSFIMEQGMLRGLKKRAEALASERLAVAALPVE